MKKMVRTKIICTLGPASGNKTVLRKMAFKGMDVARLNFSHSGHDALREYIMLISGLNAKYRRHIRILGDLEGYRIRIGALEKPVELKKRETLQLTQKETLGQDRTVPFDYKGPLVDIKKGQLIYIDDGNIALIVTHRRKKTLETKVVIGGVIKEHKGVNMPGVRLKFHALSEKDKKDISFCVEERIDYIAQSFVRSEGDILRIKEYIGRGSFKPRIVAKIENREGIRNIDGIIDASDGIMIARGDMGVSLPIYEVPVIQKEIIKKCNRKGKFVITATQMLESMTENHIPTRAEVTDVANAVLDGTDFVMLSAETAVGRYPAEAIDMMNKIIRFTETHAIQKR